MLGLAWKRRDGRKVAYRPRGTISPTLNHLFSTTIDYRQSSHSGQVAAARQQPFQDGGDPSLCNLTPPSGGLFVLVVFLFVDGGISHIYVSPDFPFARCRTIREPAWGTDQCQQIRYPKTLRTYSACSKSSSVLSASARFRLNGNRPICMMKPSPKWHILLAP
jgi:hypothetical protein